MSEKKKRGVKKQPPETLYHRRYFSLPPDVVKFLDEQPSGQRSKIVAEAVRRYRDFIANDSQHVSRADSGEKNAEEE